MKRSNGTEKKPKIDLQNQIPIIISFEARSGANKETSIRFEPKQASADRMEWNNKETEDWSRKLNTHHHFLKEENRRILLYLLQVALNFKKRWQQSYKHETEANQASKDQMEQQIQQRMMYEIEHPTSFCLRRERGKIPSLLVTDHILFQDTVTTHKINAKLASRGQKETQESAERSTKSNTHPSGREPQNPFSTCYMSH